MRKEQENIKEMYYVFASRLKQLRAEKRLSQRELAERLQVTRTSVANWENMIRFPREGVLLELARMFGVSSDYLCGKTDIRYQIHLPNMRELDTGILNKGGLNLLFDFYDFLRSNDKYTVK